MKIDIARLSESAQSQIRKAQATLQRERSTRPSQAAAVLAGQQAPKKAGQRGMNSWEADYAARLAADPTVAWSGYEPMRLRLAKSTGYTPDFIVVRTTGEIEAHEVKGFWRDDARVKLKVAAEQYSFIKFFVCRRLKGQWFVEELP